MGYLLFATFATAAVLILRHNARVQRARDMLAKMQTYEHVSSPILVTSNFPDDPTVEQRALAWRENLRAARNKYSEVLPIVPYPFALGADPKLGALITWRQYQINAALRFQQELAVWDERIAKENPAMNSQHIFSQNPTNPN